MEQHKITAETEFENLADIAVSAGSLGFMDDRFIETMNDALASSRSIMALIISGPEEEYAFERQKGRTINWVNNSPRFKNRFDFSRESLYKPLRIQGLRNVNIQAVSLVFDYPAVRGILKETLLLILAGLIIAFFTMLMESLLVKSSGKTYTADNSSGTGKNEENEQNLYSPRGICREEYTKRRLESELHRCASMEKDLTLIVMEFTERLDNAKFKQAAAEAAALFTPKDLLFENGKQGISAVCPGIGLEKGLTKSRKFRQRITEIFSRSNTDYGLCIGLTSRSGRLLDAGRMLLEAIEALQKAKSDPDDSPIIAFKSDPDKYRAFIASQSP
jgi:hypothetical protein